MSALRSIKKLVKAQLAKWPATHDAALWLYKNIVKQTALEEQVSARIPDLLNGCRDVIFVQVGANDGLRRDPIQRLVKRNPGWRGVFVEPVSFIFDRLVKNYRSDPRYHFINKAVGQRAEQVPFYYIDEKAARSAGIPLPFWFDQINSFDKNHIVNLLGPEIEQAIRMIYLDVLPLQSILDQCHISAIDLLHIDVEGFDWQVLHQLNFELYRPAVIMFEHKHVSEEHRMAAKKTLEFAGYQLSSDHTDTLCVNLHSLQRLRDRQQTVAAA